jgi:hypothetical protein
MALETIRVEASESSVRAPGLNTAPINRKPSPIPQFQMKV